MIGNPSVLNIRFRVKCTNVFVYCLNCWKMYSVFQILSKMCFFCDNIHNKPQQPALACSIYRIWWFSLLSGWSGTSFRLIDLMLNNITIMINYICYYMFDYNRNVLSLFHIYYINHPPMVWNKQSFKNHADINKTPNGNLVLTSMEPIYNN